MLDADRPITDNDEDLLDRGPLVDRLADWVRSAPTADGFVIGLTGPWGAGKTSVLRLLEKRLDQEVIVVWFEPWLFSDADQLVTRFFDELSVQMIRGKTGKAKQQVAKLGARLADYGAALSPAASVALGPAGQIMAAPKQLAALREVSASVKRRELRKALLKHPYRFVVLIDDIDRLDPREVREVLRLVKLVADLPGVVHILSYERSRVERALKLGEENGRAYLQKIIQASMAVPPVSRDRLRTLSLGWLQEAIGENPLESWDLAAWSALFYDGIDGFLQTLRDGRRLANMAPAALDLCGDEVAAMDVLALEALRIFDPDVHEALPKLADALVGSRGIFDLRSGDQGDKEQREKLDAILESSSHPDVTRHVLVTLFPAAGVLLGGTRSGDDPRWHRQKRVASRPVLMRYLHQTLASGEVGSAVVDAAVGALADGVQLETLLEDVEDARLADLIDRTRSRIGEQADPDIVGCAHVLLRAAPRIPPKRGPIELDPTKRALWLIDALLQTAKTAEERADLARQVIATAPTLSLRVQLLHRYRTRPAESSKEPEIELLSDAAFAEFATPLAAEIQATEAEQLAAEPLMLWLLEHLRDVSGPEAVLNCLREQRALCAVLTSTGTSVRPLTDYGVSLNINALVTLAGNDVLDPLNAMAENPDALDEEVRAALRIALDRYAGSDDASR